MRKHFILALCCCIVLTVRAQVTTRDYIDDAGLSPRDHPLDFTKMQLHLALDPAAGLVKGSVTHYFTPLRPDVDSFFLDAIKMDIKEVLLNGKAVNYRNDSAGLTIHPGESLHWNNAYTLTISYEAKPKRGLYFIGWKDPNNLSRKQVWSQGEGIDNRYWIPMYDERNDKLLTELFITFDKAYQVLSNGKLEDKKENTDGTLTWHYSISHPHAPYLVMLGIGKYAIKETHAASGVPMHLYYYPEWKDRVETTYKYSEAMVDFFEKEIGVPYPWESYSQIPVQDYMFGAMENTTATVFGDFFLVDPRGYIDRNYIAVNAHELAHQWFGDYVTARSESHIWLQESFATYYNQLFEREVFGQDYFDWARRGSENAAIEESAKNKLAVAHSLSGGVRIYGKGAFVLNMLKYVVGGTVVYNKAIKYYLEKHPYQNVDSHDLLIAFEESTGMQLDWFWDEWIYHGGEPVYDVNFSETGNTGDLTVRQTQETNDVTGVRKGLYAMPVNIEIHYTDGTMDRQVHHISQQTEIIKMVIPEGKKTAFVLFDPGNEILKSIHFSKPFSMLELQASQATNLLDRYDAVVSMRGIDIAKKRLVLAKVFGQEKFYPVKNEVIAQLSGDDDAASRQLIKDALSAKDAAVRKAALKYASPLSPGLLPVFENLLSDSSYEITETALTKLCNIYPSKTAGYLAKTKNIEGNVGRNVQVRWLEISFGLSGKKQFGDQLVNFTSNSYEFRARTNAMAALKRCAYFSEALIGNLVDAILSPNDRLSAPANDLLKFFAAQDKYKSTIHDYISSHQWEDGQKSILTANGFL